ncbi:DoxX family protein [Corynebacterium sp. ZY180755]
MSDSKLKRPIGSIVLDVVSFVARFYMAYIWIKAGWSKIGDHMTVMQSVQGYEIFTEQWASYIARVIGPLEIAGGVLLLLGIFLRFSGILSTIVLSLFIIGIAQAWARGIVTDCGCFGATEVDGDVGMNYAKTIARDVFYIFLSMWTVFRPFRKFALHA